MFDVNRTLLFITFILIVFLLGLISEGWIINDELLINHLSQQLEYDRVLEILDFNSRLKWLNYVLIPVIYLLKFSLITLWIMSGIFILKYDQLYEKEKTDNLFGKIFHAVMVAEFVWLIPSIIMLVWFGFINTNYTFTDIQYFKPLSLLNFFEVEELESWLIFPLQSVTLFEVVYVLVLAIGVQRILKQGYNSALSFTVPVYGSALLTWIVFITFLNINLS